jgi:hypothetical protein
MSMRNENRRGDRRSNATAARTALFACNNPHLANCTPDRRMWQATAISHAIAQGTICQSSRLGNGRNLHAWSQVFRILHRGHQVPTNRTASRRQVDIRGSGAVPNSRSLRLPSARHRPRSPPAPSFVIRNSPLFRPLSFVLRTFSSPGPLLGLTDYVKSGTLCNIKAQWVLSDRPECRALLGDSQRRGNVPMLIGETKLRARSDAVRSEFIVSAEP